MPQMPYSRDGRDYYRTTDGDERLLSVAAGEDPRALYPGKLAYASEEDYNRRQAEKAAEQAEAAQRSLDVDPALNRDAAGNFENPDAAFGSAPVDLAASPLSDEGLAQAQQAQEQTVEDYLALPKPPPAPETRNGRDYYKAPNGKMLSVSHGGDPSELVEGAVPATAKEVDALIQGRSGGWRDSLAAFPSGGRVMVGQAIAGTVNAVEAGIEKATGFGTKPGLVDREIGSRPLSAADIYPDEYTDKAKEVREANPTATMLGAVAADYTIQAALDTVLPGSSKALRAGSYAARQLAAGILTEAGDSAITGDEFSMSDALFVWTPTNMAFEAVAPPVLRGAAKALGWTGKTAARGGRNALDWIVERSNTRAVDDALRETDPVKRAAKFRTQAENIYARQQKDLDAAFEIIDEKIQDAPNRLFTPSALGKSVSKNPTVQGDVTMRFAQSLDHAAQVTGNDTVKEAFELLYDALGKEGPAQYGALRQAWQMLGDAGIESPLVREAVDGIAETLGDAKTWGKAASHHAGIMADIAEAGGAAGRRSVRDAASREAIDRQLERARSIAKLSDNKQLSGAVAKAEEALRLGGEVTGARAMGGALPDEVAELRKVIGAFPDRMPALTEELTETLDGIALPDTWTAERAEALLVERAAGKKSARAIDKTIDDAERALKGKPAAERVPALAKINRARDLLAESDAYADAARRVREFDAEPKPNGAFQKIAHKLIDSATSKAATGLIGKGVSALGGHAMGGVPGALSAMAVEHTIEPAVRAKAKQVGSWLKKQLRKHAGKALGAGLLVGSANAPTDDRESGLKAMLANAGLLVLFLPHGGSALMGERLTERLGALTARERFTLRQATERAAATQADFLRRFAAGERSFEHPAFGRQDGVDPTAVRDMQYTVALDEYARLHGTDVDSVPDHIKDALTDDMYYRNAKLIESDPELLRLAQVRRFDVVQGEGQAATGSADLRRFGLPDPEQVAIRQMQSSREPGFVPEAFASPGTVPRENRPFVIDVEHGQTPLDRIMRSSRDPLAGMVSTRQQVEERRLRGHGETRELSDEEKDALEAAFPQARRDIIVDARQPTVNEMVRALSDGDVAKEIYIRQVLGDEPPAGVDQWIEDAVFNLAAYKVDVDFNGWPDANDVVRLINSGETSALGRHTLTPWEEYYVRRRFEETHDDVVGHFDRILEERQRDYEEELEREREAYGDEDSPDSDVDSAPPSSAPPSSGGPRAEVVALPTRERGPARETGGTADVVPMRRRGEPEPSARVESEPENAPPSAAPTDERATRIAEFEPPHSHAQLADDVNDAYRNLRETGWGPEETMGIRAAFDERRAELRSVLESYATGEPHVRPGGGSLIELSSREAFDREQLGIMRQELRRRNLGEGEGANVRAVIDAELARINAADALDLATPRRDPTEQVPWQGAPPNTGETRRRARLQNFVGNTQERLYALYTAARDEENWIASETAALREAGQRAEREATSMLDAFANDYPYEGGRSFESTSQLLDAQRDLVLRHWRAHGGPTGTPTNIGEMLVSAEVNAINNRASRRLLEQPAPAPRPYEPPQPEITADTPDVMLPLDAEERALWDQRIRDATEELHENGDNIDADNLIDTLSRMQDPVQGLEPHVEVYVRMQTGERAPDMSERVTFAARYAGGEEGFYSFDADDLVRAWESYDGNSLTPWEEYHFRQQFEADEHELEQIFSRERRGPDSYSSDPGSENFQGSFGRRDGDGLPDDTELGEAGLTAITVHSDEGIRNVFGRDELTTEDLRQIFALDHLKAHADATGNALETSITVERNVISFRGVVRGTEFEISTTYKPGPNGVNVEHNLLVIPPELQGKGEARKLLQDMVKAFERLGVNEVSLNAAWVGRYVWAALGARPSAEAERAARQLFEIFLKGAVPDEGNMVVVPVLKRIQTLRDLADAAVPLESVPAAELQTMRGRFRSLQNQSEFVGKLDFDDAIIGKHPKTGAPVVRVGKYFLLSTQGPWNNGMKMEVRPGTPWYEQFKLRIGASAIALGLGLKELFAAMNEGPLTLGGLHPAEEERRQRGTTALVSPPGAEEQARAIRDGVTMAVEAFDEREAAVEETREKLAYLAHRSRLAITNAARALASPEPQRHTVPVVPGITHSAGVARFLGDNGSLREAFDARRDSLKQLQRDPMAFVEDMAESLGELADNAPDLHAEVVAQTYKVANFIQSKMPNTVGVSLVRPDGATPSPLAIRQFALYYSAATDPSTVIEDVTNNRARKEQLDTLREVWPDTYMKLKLAVLDQISRTRPTVNQRIRLDLQYDFGENLDRALAPGLAATYQAARAAAKAPPEGGQVPSRRSNPSVGGTGALGSLALGPASGPGTLA